MVAETIKVIKETEAQAAEIMKKAEEEYNELLDKASQDAKILKDQNVAEANAKARADMEAEKANGEQALKSAMSDVEKEILALREIAYQKEGEAVQQVISQLV